MTTVRTKLDVEGRFLSGDFAAVDVYIRGEFLATVPVIAGSFDVDIDTDDGHVVPDVAAGDLVEVVDSNTLELMFIGNFNNNRGGNGGGGGGKELRLEIELTNLGANPLASATAKHRNPGQSTEVRR